MNIPMETSLEYADVLNGKKPRDIWMELLNSQDPKKYFMRCF
jgi:hypothetical protein